MRSLKRAFSTSASRRFAGPPRFRPKTQPSWERHSTWRPSRRPETIRRSISGRDVFALGAIVYEMLSGRPAFDGQTIPEVVFKVVYEEPTPLDQVCAAPPGIARAVHQALAKKQEERFPTVEAFIEALSGTALSVRGAPIPTGVQPKVEDVGLASTVASGNHPNPLAATGAQSSAALGTAATIDSGRLESHSLGLPPQPTGRGPVAESAVAHGHPPARTGEIRRGRVKDCARLGAAGWNRWCGSRILGTHPRQQPDSGRTRAKPQSRSLSLAKPMRRRSLSKPTRAQ